MRLPRLLKEQSFNYSSWKSQCKPILPPFYKASFSFALIFLDLIEHIHKKMQDLGHSPWTPWASWLSQRGQWSHSAMAVFYLIATSNTLTSLEILSTSFHEHGHTKFRVHSGPTKAVDVSGRIQHTTIVWGKYQINKLLSANVLTVRFVEHKFLFLETYFMLNYLPSTFHIYSYAK